MTKPRDSSTSEKDASDKREWQTGAVLLGTGLIVAGVVFLLGSLGIIDVYLGNILHLWPLVVIGAGISLLKLTGVWRVVVTGVFIVVSLCLLVVTLTNSNGIFRQGQSDNRDRQSRVSINRLDTSVDRFALTIDTGAIKMNIDSQDGRQLASATLNASDRFRLEQESTITGSTQETTIATKSSGFGLGGLRDNQLNVRVTRELPLQLRINAGATSLDADLSDVRLQELTVDAGASKLNTKLGSREATLKVTIDAGASSVTLQIPKDSGIRFEHDGGLTGTDFQDVPMIADGVYESADFDTAAKKIIIQSDTGASSIKIKRY